MTEKEVEVIRGFIEDYEQGNISTLFELCDAVLSHFEIEKDRQIADLKAENERLRKKLIDYVVFNELMKEIIDIDKMWRSKIEKAIDEWIKDAGIPCETVLRELKAELLSTEKDGCESCSSELHSHCLKRPSEIEKEGDDVR